MFIKLNISCIDTIWFLTDYQEQSNLTVALSQACLVIYLLLIPIVETLFCWIWLQSLGCVSLLYYHTAILSNSGITFENPNSFCPLQEDILMYFFSVNIDLFIQSKGFSKRSPWYSFFTKILHWSILEWRCSYLHVMLIVLCTFCYTQCTM